MTLDVISIDFQFTTQHHLDVYPRLNKKEIVILLEISEFQIINFQIEYKEFLHQLPTFLFYF